MEKQMTFGNAELAKKMVSRFGEVQESVKTEIRYAADVESFIRKIEDARREAAKSTLVFG